MTKPLPLAPLVDALRARSEPVLAGEQAAAAVATILRDGPGGAEVLFIERATRDGDPWSGHVAFPGGKRDGVDASLLDTAVRETREEIGLVLQAASVLARLEDVVARSNGYRVAQFVFVLDDPAPALHVNGEVAAVWWTPLSALASPEREGTVTIARDGVSLQVPSVLLGDRVLWGMTYRMIQQLLELAGARAGA